MHQPEQWQDRTVEMHHLGSYATQPCMSRLRHRIYSFLPPHQPGQVKHCRLSKVVEIAALRLTVADAVAAVLLADKWMRNRQPERPTGRACKEEQRDSQK